jgi:hypothetical protein
MVAGGVSATLEYHPATVLRLAARTTMVRGWVNLGCIFGKESGERAAPNFMVFTTPVVV